MSEEAGIIHRLKQILGKYQQDLGLLVWGTTAKKTQGNYRVLYVDDDGKLVVSATISGTIDMSDRWARQLGQIDIARYLGSAVGLTNPLHSQIVYGGAVIDPRSIRALVSSDIITAYGGQTQALLQRATTYDLLVQLRNAGVEIDPRSIRALAKATDEVYSVLRTDVGVAYDARQIRALTSSDIITAYGSQSQKLLQRALTYETVVQLSHQGSEYDSRQIRALTSSDVVSLVSNDLKTIRWGITREPTWTDGAEATAPAAGATLVSKTVTAGMTGRVFGVHISADEANQFQLLVNATVIKRFALGGAGVIHIVLALPLKDSIAAASVITIKNVTAGAALKVYQASLLYDEA